MVDAAVEAPGAVPPQVQEAPQQPQQPPQQPQPDAAQQVHSQAPREDRVKKYTLWALQRRLAELTALVEGAVIEVRTR